MIDPKLERLYRLLRVKPSYKAQDTIDYWLEFFDLEEDILPTIEHIQAHYKGDEPPTHPNYYSKAIQENYYKRLGL